MGKKYDFNYIVIGSGPAGSAAAFKLAQAKKRVALVEARFFGGSHLNTHDIPYEVALDFAHTFSKASSYPELRNHEFTFNFPTIAARELSTVVAAGGNNQKPYEDAGIICLSGFANFLDAHTIAVNQKQFTAETFILATGSHPKISEIAGTNVVSFHTPESAIKLHHLPQYVAIVGGGSTGCELDEYYAELGVKVVLLEMAPNLLPREDQEVGEAISDYFTRRLGISIFVNSKVIALERDEFSDYLVFHCNGAEKMVRIDTIVLATGSEPTLNYGLENAGVKYKPTGITVNKFFQTSAKNIYAVGDCLGGESSTDRAHLEGSTLAANLISNTKSPINYNGLVRVTKTHPEVAVVGLTENDLIRRDRKYKKVTIPFSDILASKINNSNYGFVKLLIDRNYRILGATIVAPNASLIAGEIALAIRHNFTALEIASTPHSLNSYNYAIKLAARKLLGKNPAKKTKHAAKKHKK